MRRAAALLIFLAACGDDGGTPALDAAADDGVAPIDAALADAADPDAALVECTSPDPCPWIDDELRYVVAVLSGGQEYAPGLRMNRRASAAERTVARDWLVAELGQR